MRPFVATLAAGFLLAAMVPPAAADCTCRARGVVAAHGQILCIRTPEGTRLARCGKVSNVASWTFLEGPCPTSGGPRSYAKRDQQSAGTIR